MSASPSQSLSYGGGGGTVAASGGFKRDKGKGGQSCDWISSLPDTILCFILSFLSTKDAVATSVLSKRWKPLWRSVPTIDFNDSIFHDRTKEDHARLVHSVSALFHLQHPVHKFRIWSFSPFTDPAYITVWLNAAVQRRVHHLDLFLGYAHWFTPINLSSIFNCKTLTVLKLMGCKLDTFSSVNLPSLHVLELEDLNFSEKRACLLELLSGCPVLEDFAETRLQIGGHVPHNHTEFQTLPNLLRADITTSYADFLLKMVNNVKFLHIDVIGDSIVRDPDSYVFPMFHNLTHIELEYSYYYYHHDWSEVVELLKHCPKLQVLVIDQPDTDDDSDSDSDLSKQIEYPPSMLHLKLCTKELEFSRYIAEDSKEDGNMEWRWRKA